MHPWLSLLWLIHLDCSTLALVSTLFKLLLKKHVYTTSCALSFTLKKKKIVFYSSVYKIEPESLENADIRFLSSWSFFYLSTCFGTRLVHIYLWFIIYADLIVILELGWFWYICGVVFMGVYIFNFCLTAFWVYLSSDI